MLSKLSILDMVYLTAENQPEGSNPFRLEKGQPRSGWEIAIVQGGQRFGTQHCRPWDGLYSADDGSNNPRFIYAAFHFSKCRVVTFAVPSRSSQQQPIGERA
jgi:hypothetical protein